MFASKTDLGVAAVGCNALWHCTGVTGGRKSGKQESNLNHEDTKDTKEHEGGDDKGPGTRRVLTGSAFVSFVSSWLN
jgi:hypothetical protein